MIRLFTTAFSISDPKRHSEYCDALRRNIACDAIDEICLLVEGVPELALDSRRLHKRLIDTRPTYSDFVSWINEVAQPGDTSIIANADIYFENQLKLLRKWTIPSNTALALSRWETSGATPRLNDRNDSQDAWMFRGKVKPVDADYLIGVPRCDNRFAAELMRAGYIVLNPSFSIRSYHLHSDNQQYPTGDHPDFVDPPYGYVWPHNLFPLHATVALVFTTGARPGWRLDKRLWSRRLKLHWFRRAFGLKIGSSRNPRGRDDA